MTLHLWLPTRRDQHLPLQLPRPTPVLLVEVSRDMRHQVEAPNLSVGKSPASRLLAPVRPNHHPDHHPEAPDKVGAAGARAAVLDHADLDIVEPVVAERPLDTGCLGPLGAPVGCHRERRGERLGWKGQAGQGAADVGGPADGRGVHCRQAKDAVGLEKRLGGWMVRARKKMSKCQSHVVEMQYLSTAAGKMATNLSARRPGPG